MNNAMKYSLSAVFTGLATSYFASTGMVKIISASRVGRPAPIPLIAQPPAPSLGTPVATEKAEEKGHMPEVPAMDPALVNELKDGQETQKTKLEALTKVMLEMEESGKAGAKRADALDVKLTEAQNLVQQFKDKLEEAQGRLTKLEAALKVTQDTAQQNAAGTKKLVKMYSSMTPEKAAKILSELPNSEVADLLSKMKDTEVAGILALFPPKRAASISARMSGHKGGPP